MNLSATFLLSAVRDKGEFGMEKITIYTETRMYI